MWKNNLKENAKIQKEMWKWICPIGLKRRGKRGRTIELNGNCVWKTLLVHQVIFF